MLRKTITPATLAVLVNANVVATDVAAELLFSIGYSTVRVENTWNLYKPVSENEIFYIDEQKYPPIDSIDIVRGHHSNVMTRLNDMSHAIYEQGRFVVEPYNKPWTEVVSSYEMQLLLIHYYEPSYVAEGDSKEVQVEAQLRELMIADKFYIM